MSARPPGYSVGRGTARGVDLLVRGSLKVRVKGSYFVALRLFIITMCSLVEIKNHNEIYIHYLSGEQNKAQNLTIVGDDNNNSVKDISITHKNHVNEKVDDKMTDGSEEDRTSDRASSMESSMIVEDTKTHLDSARQVIKDTLEDETKKASEKVTKKTSEDVKGALSTHVEVTKDAPETVTSKEMSTQVDAEAGPVNTKSVIRRNRSTQVESMGEEGEIYTGQKKVKPGGVTKSFTGPFYKMCKICGRHKSS